MKRIILTKTSPVTQQSTDGSTTTLSDRKSMLGSYKRLFEALLDLPDKKVVARVLDAINHKDKNPTNFDVIELCRTCNKKNPKYATVDASTQTVGKVIMQHSSAGNSDDSRDASPIQSISKITFNTAKESSNEGDTRFPAKRKRRRKMQIPQVIKKSQAQEQQQRNKPVLQKRKASALSSNDDAKKMNQSQSNTKRQRQDSVSSGISLISDLFKERDLQDLLTPEEIKEIMLKELLISEQTEEDGLLPIHSAIVKNDSKFLKRQIFIWKQVNGTDLNELLTNDEEDCLQLSLSENSLPEIVKVLLDAGLDPNCQDAKLNTIIHLAVLNEAPIEVMYHLMEKIDLNSLFVLNHDGYTSLHLAVRKNNFMLAEAFLNVLDKRLLGKPHFERNPEQNEKKFLKYYETCCSSARLQSYIHKYKSEQLSKKRKILDAGDIRGGNTVLLYAIENKLDHFIFFLLAHFADPRVESLSGQSPSSFINEYAKCLNLSHNPYKVIDNVSFLLDEIK